MAALAELQERIRAAKPYTIGFPAAVDLDWAPLAPLLTGGLLNNVGSPDDEGIYACHTKAMEREVLNTFAQLFRANGRVRGHVTAGATEGTLWALLQARRLYPNTMVFCSSAAHYSVPKTADLLSLPIKVLPADDTGELDYGELRRALRANAGQAATVVANVGTTMTEAIDDVRLIRSIVDEHTRAAWIHADAALSGVPLALLDPSSRPGLDFTDGADSLVVSGHKFLGALHPCAVVLARNGHTDADLHVAYIDAHDATIAGSRSGHGPLMLWYLLRTLGMDGLRQRAHASRALAKYTHHRLNQLGWAALRHRHAFTVVLKTPPCAIADRWQLPTEDGWSHIICMPGITRTRIDAFLSDLESCITLRDPQ
jgi:histidine decarboxylase